jgi:hypothetical protein
MGDKIAVYKIIYRMPGEKSDATLFICLCDLKSILSTIAWKRGEIILVTDFFWK